MTCPTCNKSYPDYHPVCLHCDFVRQQQKRKDFQKFQTFTTVKQMRKARPGGFSHKTIK